MKVQRRRTANRLLATIAGVALAATMAACSSSDSGGTASSGDSASGSGTAAQESSDSGDSPSAEPTQITFSYLWDGDEAKTLEKIIADFNASQSEVVVKGVSSPDFQKQLTSMSASTPAFDISDNFGDSVGSWASKGILAPLDELLAAEGVDTADFVPSAMDQMRYDGKLYALPIAIHSLMLVYNKTLLDEAGLKPPTTIDELTAAALALTKTDDSGKITQLGLGETMTGHFATNIVAAFGGSWWDADGQPSPLADHNVDAMNWYQGLVKQIGADKISSFAAGYGQYVSAEDPFFTGKVAMRLDGEWIGISADQVAPDLDWGVTAIPYAAPEYENATQVSSSTLFIPANSAHKEAAAKFLAYMMSPESMTTFTEQLGNLPGRTALLDNADAYARIPHFTEFAQALKSPNAFSPSSAANAAEYTTDLGRAIESIVHDTATPEQALQDLADAAKAYAN